MDDTHVLSHSLLMEWIEEGEHQHQDFKYKISDSKKLARTVSAFANTDGGRLLIGVRDDKVLSGVRSDEEIYMVHCAAEQYCQPAPEVRYETLGVAGRNIVVATVNVSNQRPVRAVDEQGRWLAYIRVADENIVASPVHLCIWREEGSPAGVLTRMEERERQIIEALSYHEASPLRRVVRRSGVARPRVIETLAHLVRYGVARCDYDGQEFLFSLNNP